MNQKAKKRRHSEKQNVNKPLDFKMASISLLPDELLLDIFAYLDAIDINSCVQVSKRFREILKEQTIQKRILQSGQPIPPNLIVFFYNNNCELIKYVLNL